MGTPACSHCLLFPSFVRLTAERSPQSSLLPVVMTYTGEGGQTQLCFLCGRPGRVQCPSCGDVWFCCSTHGTVHHRPHLASCFPWRVETVAGKGRVMVTTRDVTAGETLFMEVTSPISPICPLLQTDCYVCRSQ